MEEILFLELDDVNEEVYQLFIDLANKKITKDKFIQWYKLNSKKIQQ